MSAKFFNRAKFLISAPSIGHLPDDTGCEVAFLGRSNSGKSSAINAIVRQKNLAKTSSVPGKTAMLNIFEFDQERRLVDVPGFGYAKVSMSTRESWRKLINSYLEQRNCLRAIVLVMDSRHPLKPQDQHLIEWLQHANVEAHIILTKADKLKNSEKNIVLASVQKQLPSKISVSLFSAKTNFGLSELHAKLATWYAITD